MTRTDGEHELVLGNKQLLSAFFVVVVLLGVFFTMGYFVGKNTATAGFNSGPSAAGGTRADGTGKPLDSGSTTASSIPPDSTAAASDPNASSATPPPPTEAKPEPKAEAPVAHKEKKPVEEPSTPSASTEEMAQPSSEQKYLQVSAVRRPDADNMVKVLREHGFPARLGESSKPELFRVLVGPFKTTSELGRTKADLKAKGFESIVAK